MLEAPRDEVAERKPLPDNAWYNPARAACYDVANLYYSAVRLFGGRYYNSGSTSTPMR